MGKISRINSAQATVEMTVSMMAILVFLVGIAHVFAWFNGRYVERCEAFERTRAARAGQAPDVNFYLIDDGNKLNVFKGQK